MGLLYKRLVVHSSKLSHSIHNVFGIQTDGNHQTRFPTSNSIPKHQQISCKTFETNIANPKSAKMPSSMTEEQTDVQTSQNEIQKQYGMDHFTFLTSSFKKLAEVKHILGEDFPIEVQHSNLDMDEYQGDPDFIVKEKCKLAAQHVSPVLVEDTCVFFEAWNGLPGPYIKWFDETVKAGGMVNMLRAVENKRAYCESRLAFTMGPDQPIYTFTGRSTGQIVEALNPEGTWTSAFQPDGFDKVYDQLDLPSKGLVSERKPSVQQFKQFILERKHLTQQQ